jgi:GPH family glycoside/pentoside/hexuronide:cation symporter
LFGFIANEVQSETSIYGIRLMFSIFPALLATLSAAVIYFYPLSDEKVAVIEAELKQRHRANIDRGTDAEAKPA